MYEPLDQTVLSPCKTFSRHDNYSYQLRTEQRRLLVMKDPSLAEPAHNHNAPQA